MVKLKTPLYYCGRMIPSETRIALPPKLEAALIEAKNAVLVWDEPAASLPDEIPPSGNAPDNTLPAPEADSTPAADVGEETAAPAQETLQPTPRYGRGL